MHRISHPDTIVIIILSISTLNWKHYWCLESTSSSADPAHSLSSFDSSHFIWFHSFASSLYTVVAKLAPSFRTRELACLTRSSSLTGDSSAKDQISSSLELRPLSLFSRKCPFWCIFCLYFQPFFACSLQHYNSSDPSIPLVFCYGPCLTTRIFLLLCI